ncbi:MAG: efflux RND transporter periplasmic adaptor subunit [Atribacterota bacterium]
MRRNSPFFSVIVAIFFLLSGCGMPGNRSQSEGAGPRNTLQMLPSVKVVRGSITESVSELGTLEPLDRVEVKLVEAVAASGGEIKKILVKEGETVFKGQPLMELDTEELEINLLSAEASLESARAELAQVMKRPTEVELRQREYAYQQALIEYQNAKTALERSRRLFASGGISQEELNASEQNVLLREKALRVTEAELRETQNLPDQENLAIAQSAVTRAEANLRSIRKKIEASTIASPIEGTVMKIDVREEEMVAVGKTLAVVADLRTMKAVIPVNEVDVPKVKSGQRAIVKLDAYPGREFEGKVINTSQQESISGNVVTYETIIHLDNSEGLLRSGMTVDVQILCASKENTLVIPFTALQEEGGETYVLVKKGERETERRPVKVGLRSETTVEIVEGLEEGEEVVIALGSRSQVTAGGSTEPETGGPPM